jgi:hypothetical protein
MAKLEFHDPSGTVETLQPCAQRLNTLEGKRIGFVSNDQWQAHRMLPLIRSWLATDFPGAELLPFEAYPQGLTFIGTDETAAAVKESQVDAVIVGNAA